MAELVVNIPGGNAAEVVANGLADALREGLKTRGHASLVVTGGSTPGPVYDLLSHQRLIWGEVDVTLSDERWVPIADPASNERMVRNRLLVGAAAHARFVSLKTDAETPEAAEPEVERRLSAMRTPFDAVLLGMGKDGHIASLFPGMDRLAEGLDPNAAALCIGVKPGVGRPPSEPRMSLTLAAVTRARRIIVFVTGPEKKATFQRMMQGTDVLEMPIRALMRSQTPIEVIVGE